jgi:putative phosphoesterase
MLVGVISDVHGNAPALAAVLRRLRDVDMLLCLGDAVGYYPFSAAVCAALRRRCSAHVAGNHDRYVQTPPATPNALLRASLAMTSQTLPNAARAWLASLPDRFEIELDGMKILATHGSPWNPTEEYVYPDHTQLARFGTLAADVVFLGHTHRPMTLEVGSVRVVNPGSVGQPRDGNPDAAFAVLDTRTRAIRFERVAYSSAGVVRRLPRWYSDPAHVRRLTAYISASN